MRSLLLLSVLVTVAMASTTKQITLSHTGQVCDEHKHDADCPPHAECRNVTPTGKPTFRCRKVGEENEQCGQGGQAWRCRHDLECRRKDQDWWRFWKQKYCLKKK
jgi:hypothetical protein